MVIVATPWRDVDDSSSFTGSTYSTATSSTVFGPGATTGKFLKAVGEHSLDFFVSIAIRLRLGTIERILEKNPRVLRNPIGDKEWDRLIRIYADLHELCRESRSNYYAFSAQKAAANLVREITLITRPEPDFFIDASPTNEKWEALFARVQRRGELLAQPQSIVRSPKKRNSLSSYLTSSSTNEKLEALLTRVRRHSEPVAEPQVTLIRSGKRDSNSSCLETGSPTDGNDVSDGSVQLEAKHPHESADDKRNRRISFRDRIFKSRKSGLPEDQSGDPPPHPYDSTRKILVLGAGGVGKSTLVKQIQAIAHDFSSRDAEPYGDVIFTNTMESMRNILFDVDPLNLSDDARGAFQHIMEGNIFTWVRCPELGEAIMTLWREPAVRHSARRAKLGMLSEPGLQSADYFFESAQRIFASGYEPVHEDIVRSRVRTSGIWENSFHIQDFPWLLIDTGGERSERKKWVNCYENTTAILFVVALTDYNKTLFEDPDVNRMEESLTLFESIVNSPWFKQSLIVLLFNKLDAFMETLESSPLKNHFADYSGDDSYDACHYFEHRFLSLVQDNNRSIVTKYICAINTEAVAGTFQSIQDEINHHYEHAIKSL